MNPINRTTDYIEEKGWFTSSLKPVAKEAFRDHQAEKKSKASSLNSAIQALAMGILAVTISMRFAMNGRASGVQVALPALGLHLCSQIPGTGARTTTSVPAALTLPLGPQGDEFQVNTYTSSDQNDPMVVPLVGGGFVVTWQSEGQDGSGLGVYGQRFDGSGAKVGSEFRVNTDAENSQMDPSVAPLAGGGFVVTWQSEGQDGSGFGVYGQRFDGSGVKVGSEFLINTYTRNSQVDPALLSLTDGSFVVYWNSYGQDGSSWGVYGQRFDGNGVKVGSEFPINTNTTGSQLRRGVLRLGRMGFVVFWGSDGQDGSDTQVYGQRFDQTGAKVESAFQVNANTTFGQLGSFNVTTTTLNQFGIPVLALEDGGFVGVGEGLGQDGSSWGIYGQRFDSAGVKVGSEFQVNNYTTNSQREPSFTLLSGGGLVVIWSSEGQDGSGYGIYGRIFSGKFISTLQTMIPGKSSSGFSPNLPESGDSNPSTRHQSVQTSKNGADQVESSDNVTSQTPLIAGVAMGVAVLAYSLFAGGLFFWRRRGVEDEPNRTDQLKLGYPDAVDGHSGSPGEYHMLSVAKSHYQDWPEETPDNDESHYHQNLDELNQKMGEAYGDVSSRPQHGDYDIITTAQYRDLPPNDLKEMVSERV